MRNSYSASTGRFRRIRQLWSSTSCYSWSRHHGTNTKKGRRGGLGTRILRGHSTMQREKNRSVRLVIADHEVLLRSGGRAQQSSASPAAAPEQESARPDPHHEHFTDVALVELATPLVNGIQLTSRLRSAAGQLKII